MLAGTGAGVYASLDEAVAQCIVADREYVPQTEWAARYDQRFAEYSQLYPGLKRLKPTQANQ